MSDLCVSLLQAHPAVRGAHLAVQEAGRASWRGRTAKAAAPKGELHATRTSGAPANTPSPTPLQIYLGGFDSEQLAAKSHGRALRLPRPCTPAAPRPRGRAASRLQSYFQFRAAGAQTLTPACPLAPLLLADIMALRCKGTACGILNFPLAHYYTAMLPLIERLSQVRRGGGVGKQGLAAASPALRCRQPPAQASAPVGQSSSKLMIVH